MKPIIGKYVFVASLVSLPVLFAPSATSTLNPSAEATADRGTAIFRKSCSVCHSAIRAKQRLAHLYMEFSVKARGVLRKQFGK
jgi:cytochrome c